MIESLNKRDKDMKKKGSKIRIILLSFFSLIMILIIMGVFFVKNYYEDQMEPLAKTNVKEINIEIPMGSSIIKIANILEENKLIKNELLFRINAKILGMDSNLKAGNYVLNNGMTPEEILQALQEGSIPKDTVKFTIPEGFELKEIAERLSNQGLVDKDRFDELVSNPLNFTDKFPFLSELTSDLNLEGYLYPDTYEIFVGSTEEEIIEKMLERFEEIYTPSIIEKADKLGMSLNEVITLASIIEREGMIDDERPLISAVFHNRIEKNMLLQSCATVQYLLGERKERLTFKDLEIDSQYNTYIYNGLPPGPIASPGRKSIEAAVNPADVDYFFFVANGDGSHTFSITYEEHMNAKNRN